MDINALREAVKAAERPPRKFQSETLGMPVYMRELSSREADEWSFHGFVGGADDDKPGIALDISQRAGHRARLVHLCLCDENGVRCDDKRRGLNIADVEAWPDRVIKELYEFAQKVNGLSEEAVEEQGKEFGVTPDSGSSSA